MFRSDAAPVANGHKSRNLRVVSDPFLKSPWGRYADVVAYTGFSLSHVETAALSGELHSKGERKRRRFRRDWCDEWLERGAPSGKVMEGGAA
jgi:hypothetical protein